MSKKGGMNSSNKMMPDEESGINEGLEELEILSAKLNDFNPDMDYSGAMVAYINELESKKEQISKKSNKAKQRVSREFGEYKTTAQAEEVIEKINEKIRYEVESSPAFVRFINAIEEAKGIGDLTQNEETLIMIAMEQDLLKERELGAIQNRINELGINPDDKDDRRELSFLEKLMGANGQDVNSDGVIDYKDQQLLEQEKEKILNRSPSLMRENNRNKNSF